MAREDCAPQVGTTDVVLLSGWPSMCVCEKTEATCVRRWCVEVGCLPQAGQVPQFLEGLEDLRNLQ